MYLNKLMEGKKKGIKDRKGGRMMNEIITEILCGN